MDVARTVGAAADVAQAASRRLSMDDVRVLDQLVAGLPVAKQLSIARNLLDDPRVHSTPIVRGPLAVVRSAIADVSSENVASATILKDIRTKLDTEIDRIDELIPSMGYDGHPDYAAVGSVTDGLKLIDRLEPDLLPRLA